MCAKITKRIYDFDESINDFMMHCTNKDLTKKSLARDIQMTNCSTDKAMDVTKLADDMADLSPRKTT